MKHRSARLGALYARIAEEADAVILASDSLVSQFQTRQSVVVPNGVSDEMLKPLTAPVTTTRMVHVGTLTPRFDARLAAEVLDALPEWTLDLYGQCQYPGRGERPGPDLALLLSQYAPRARWLGVVPRESLAEAIDSAAVALVFNRAEESLGQDSMKIYDYAARGRPIVATRFSRKMEREGPPHVSFVDDAQEMAHAVQASSAEPADWSQERRRWADEQRWSSRWDAWARAVFGEAD
jgi:glycosyltransferase involved in cell wall biosynthesis